MRKQIDLSKLQNKLPIGILQADAEGNLSAADVTPINSHADLENRDADDSHPGTAVSYDNTVSGLVATDMQAAADEIVDQIGDIAAALSIIVEGT